MENFYNMANLATQKQEIFDYVHAFLGGGMVDVELDPIHYETALNKALSKFRHAVIIVLKNHTCLCLLL